jgi:hypothetical protein
MSRAAESTASQAIEFVTIRWDGQDNSCVIHPDGKVDKLRPVFDRAPRPRDVDERLYYLTIAMNAVARDGYDFAGMTGDSVVMKRVSPQ